MEYTHSPSLLAIILTLWLLFDKKHIAKQIQRQPVANWATLSMQSSLRGRSNTILSNHRQLSTNPQEFILRKKRWRGIASGSLWNTEHALTEQSKSHDPCVVPYQFWLKTGEKIDQFNTCAAMINRCSIIT